MTEEVFEKMLAFIGKVSLASAETDGLLIDTLTEITSVLEKVVADIQLQEARISMLEASR
jgi:hypothetical protein